MDTLLFFLRLVLIIPDILLPFQRNESGSQRFLSLFLPLKIRLGINVYEMVYVVIGAWRKARESKAGADGHPRLVIGWAVFYK